MLRTAFRNLAPLANRNVRGMSTMSDIVSKVKSVRIHPAVLVELRPPTPAELPRAIKDGIRLFTKPNWRNLTVKEAWLNTLVATEVICWFFVGEVIGKGTLIGYQV